MSRRFSDEPINLIHRIPSPAQISAARPSQRSYGQALVETGAACVRGAAEVLAQTRRLGRMVRLVVSREILSSGSFLGQAKERVGKGIQSVTSGCVRSYEGLAEWIANLDVTVQPVRAVPQRSSEMPADRAHTSSAPVLALQKEELAELRTYILSQQEDISRLSAQLQELKSLVVSQQQVLVYLGKELESTQTQVLPVAGVASAPAKRNRVVREKMVAKDKTGPRKNLQKPSLNL